MYELELEELELEELELEELLELEDGHEHDGHEQDADGQDIDGQHEQEHEQDIVKSNSLVEASHGTHASIVVTVMSLPSAEID